MFSDVVALKLRDIDFMIEMGFVKNQIMLSNCVALHRPSIQWYIHMVYYKLLCDFAKYIRYWTLQVY